MSDARFDNLRVDGSLRFGDIAEIRPEQATVGNARLAIRALVGGMELAVYPAPGYDAVSRVITQLQLFGGEILDAAGNPIGSRRADITIWRDGAGGEAVYFGPTNTEGVPPEVAAIPLVLYADEAMYVVFHPSDQTLELKERNKATGKWGFAVRKSLAEWFR